MHEAVAKVRVPGPAVPADLAVDVRDGHHARPLTDRAHVRSHLGNRPGELVPDDHAAVVGHLGGNGERAQVGAAKAVRDDLDDHVVRPLGGWAWAVEDGYRPSPSKTAALITPFDILDIQGL
jgi:hypothetical protein